MTQILKPKQNNKYILLKPNNNTEPIRIGIPIFGNNKGKFSAYLNNWYTINELKQIIKTIKYDKQQRTINIKD